MLATAASTFATDLRIDTAASKAESLDLLARFDFDLILACEKLGDGSGLEVLSHVAVNSPNTLRIFAARPSTLETLKGELGVFGLFRILPYPINFRNLWAALTLARSCLVEAPPAPAAAPARSPATSGSNPQIRHVVLESTWETGEYLQVDQAPTIPLTESASPAQWNTPAHATVPSRSAPPAQTASPPQPAAAVRPHVATAAPVRPPLRTSTPAPQFQERIPESEIFKRALARRAAARLQENAEIAAREVARGGAGRRPQTLGMRGKQRRRDPALTTLSMDEVAQLTSMRGPDKESRESSRGLLRGWKDTASRTRRAWFVGSGVFAAGTLVAIGFFVLGSNNSMGHSSVPAAVPLVASMDDRPVSQQAFPWQAPAQQAPIQGSADPQATVAPTEGPPEGMRTQVNLPPNEGLDSGGGDPELSDPAFQFDPGHPSPPQPNAPPGPSEPPSAGSAGSNLQP